MKIQFYCPVALCDIPERIHGVELRYHVCYSHGSERDYFGRCGAISLMFKALKSRLMRDDSIFDVQVFLPSGRFLCECTRWP